MELAVALPVGGDVARVAHRQDVDVGGIAEFVHDLEGSGFLSLDAEGIDGIDDGYPRRRVAADLAHQAQGVVEISVHLHHARAVRYRLDEFAHGDFACREEDDAPQPGPGGVGGGGGAGVARGGADDGARALLARLGDGHRHAAVLEAPRRVEPLVLEEHPAAAAHALAQARGMDQGSRAFVERDDGSLFVHGQELTPAGDDSSIVGEGAVHVCGGGQTSPHRPSPQSLILCSLRIPQGCTLSGNHPPG